MALTLVSDPAQAGFNAYCSVAFATDHATSILNTTWASLTTAQKEASIIFATREMDVLQWQGSKTSGLQEHEFPRSYLWRSGNSKSIQWNDSQLDSDYLFSSTEIPYFLQQSTAELAIQLSQSNTTLPSGVEGFKSIKVSEISLEMNAKDRLSFFTDNVRNLCWRWLANSSKYNAPVVRV